jgi:hypothetical protein
VVFNEKRANWRLSRAEHSSTHLLICIRVQIECFEELWETLCIAQSRLHESGVFFDQFLLAEAREADRELGQIANALAT